MGRAMACSDDRGARCSSEPCSRIRGRSASMSNGAVMDKEPRAFDTSGVATRAERWRRFCWSGFGSGDMVYGLMRMRALEAAGIFRPVLNPDRTADRRAYAGRVRSARLPSRSGTRRQSGGASVDASGTSLFAGRAPPRFNWPPSLQHAASSAPRGFGLSMIATYVFASAWRATRKTETSKSIGRGVDNVHFVEEAGQKGVSSRRVLHARGRSEMLAQEPPCHAQSRLSNPDVHPPRRTANRPLRILFAALHYGYFRNLESVVDELARRGSRRPSDGRAAGFGARRAGHRRAAGGGAHERHLRDDAAPSEPTSFSRRRFVCRSTICDICVPDTRERQRCSAARACARRGLLRALRLPLLRAPRAAVHRTRARRHRSCAAAESCD